MGRPNPLSQSQADERQIQGAVPLGSAPPPSHTPRGQSLSGRPRGSTNANVARRRINLRRARYAEQREIDLTIQLDSLGVLEQVMKFFFIKARVLEQMGTETRF